MTKKGMTFYERRVQVDDTIRLITHELDNGRHFQRDGDTFVGLTLGDLISIRAALWLGHKALVSLETRAVQFTEEMRKESQNDVRL